MRKIQEAYPEIENIEEDFSVLKKDAVELARHVKADGAQKISEASGQARSIYESLKTQGVRELRKAEELAKEKPAQALALAFAGGIIASLLLGRR